MRKIRARGARTHRLTRTQHQVMIAVTVGHGAHARLRLSSRQGSTRLSQPSSSLPSLTLRNVHNNHPLISNTCSMRWR